MMSKSGRAVLQLGVALVLSVVVGLMVFKWMNRKPATQPQVATVQTVPVVVAAVDVPRGAKLTAKELKVAQQIEDNLPAGHFRAVEDVAGRVLDAGLTANEIITERRLAPIEVTSGGVSAMIGPGKRAMTVKGNAVMGIAGFVKPGDRVDVMVTLNTGNKQDHPLTKLVLSNVPILATGTQLEQQPETGKPYSVDLYTLELTPQEGERLALAATQGTLNFALRGAADSETVLTTGVDIPKAVAAYRPAPKPRYRRSAKPDVDIEVITGTERSHVKFKQQ